MRILYVGPLDFGSTCLQRMQAMIELGHNVVPIDAGGTSLGCLRTFATRALYRAFKYAADFAGVNRRLMYAIRQGHWDVLWIDKGVNITRKSVLAAKAYGHPIIGYSPDDMNAPHNRSRQILSHFDLYDLYFTTKSFGVEELKNLGVKRVVFVGNAYDPKTHRPMPLTDELRKKFGGPVGFIGTYEPERAASMYAIAQAGIPVRIWGSDWDRCPYKHENLRPEYRPLLADEYATAICAFDINLGFLRKINRDKQTQRSVEIPACGAFMLAERTDEHEALFVEGKEAEYFASDAELVEKCRFYLANPEARLRIAAAGRERCLTSGYSNNERIRQMLAIVEAMVPTKPTESPQA